MQITTTPTYDIGKKANIMSYKNSILTKLLQSLDLGSSVAESDPLTVVENITIKEIIETPKREIFFLRSLKWKN